MKFELDGDEIINWLPLVKELPIEQFTLSGDNVKRDDLLQLIELPLKNKCITRIINDLSEEDYPHFKQLFIDDGLTHDVKGSS